MSNESKTPNTVYEFITVSMAKAMLAWNRPYTVGVAGTNRPLRPKVVQKYADDMLAGRWETTNQGIGIADDENGDPVIIDGQHRLNAIVLAGQTNPDLRVLMAVTKGLLPSAATVIDTQMRRQGGDVLAMAHGIRNPMVVTAALRLLHLYDNVPWSLNAWTQFKPSNAQLMGFVEAYPGIEESEHMTANTGLAIPSGPLTAATHLVRRERTDLDMSVFLKGLKTGANLAERDPILALRNYGLNALKNKQRREGPQMLALTLRAINSWVVDDRRYNLRFSAAEPYPRLTERAWVNR
jgi:hypothetical protein